MNRSIFRCLAVALAAGGVALGAYATRAYATSYSTANGYVCSTSVGAPQGGGYGSGGYVTARITTGASCGGSTIGYFTWCTQGATASTACDLNYLYTPAQINTMTSGLQQASTTNNAVQINYVTGSCVSDFCPASSLMIWGK